MARQTKRCRYCRRWFAVNGIGQHETACRELHAAGGVVQFHSIYMPKPLHRRFSVWCKRQGITLREGVLRAIKLLIGRR